VKGSPPLIELIIVAPGRRPGQFAFLRVIARLASGALGDAELASTPCTRTAAGQTGERPRAIPS